MATDPVTPAATDFLGQAGWGGAGVTPLAGDASFRRYYRVSDGERSAILMDAPPPEEVAPFLAMADYLQRSGFEAPRVLAADEGRGLVLLNDLGDRRMREVVDADPATERPIYEAAVDLLLRLRDTPPAAVPPYDAQALHREAALLVDWWVPAAGLNVDREGYREAWDAVFTGLAPPAVTVLRDYHAENMMLIGAEGSSDLALLDFQDALIGHPAYDLMSLLQDARREVSPELEAAMLARYRAATGEGEAFVADYHRLGAQRNAKILGIFARLSRRDGKHRYLELMPRVAAYLARDLAHPALAPVARWFADNVPSDAAVAHP